MTKLERLNMEDKTTGPTIQPNPEPLNTDVFHTYPNHPLPVSIWIIPTLPSAVNPETLKYSRYGMLYLTNTAQPQHGTPSVGYVQSDQASHAMG